MRINRDEQGSGDLIAFIFFAVTSVLFVTLILLMGLSTRQAVVPSANRLVDAYTEKYARYGMQTPPGDSLTIEDQLKATLVATGRVGSADQIQVACGRYFPETGKVVTVPDTASSTAVDPNLIVRSGDLVGCAVWGEVNRWAISAGDLIGGDYFYMAIKTSTIGDGDYVG